MALSDSWQEKSCLRCVKRCKRVAVRCWHRLRSECVCWRMLFLLLFFFYKLTFFSFVVFGMCAAIFYPSQRYLETTGSRNKQITWNRFKLWCFFFCHNVRTRIKNVLRLSCIVRVWPWASSPFSFPSYLRSSPWFLLLLLFLSLRFLLLPLHLLVLLCLELFQIKLQTSYWKQVH